MAFRLARLFTFSFLFVLSVHEHGHHVEAAHEFHTRSHRVRATVSR